MMRIPTTWLPTVCDFAPYNVWNYSLGLLFTGTAGVSSASSDGITHIKLSQAIGASHTKRYAVAFNEGGRAEHPSG